MIHFHLSLLLISILMSSYLFSYAQGEDTTKSYTSEELIPSYYDKDFRPFSKGNWFSKMSFSLSDKELTNTARLFDRVVEGQNFSWDLKLSGGRFVGNYFLVGAGIGYNESQFTGTLINIDSDTVDAQSISRNIAFTPNIRVSIPMTKNQRLSFYNDIGMSFGYGRTLTRDTENIDEIEKLYSDQFVFGLGLSPGITFFAVENFAMEVGINVIGYRLNIENSIDGNGVESRKVENDVSFRVNLLSLNIGMAYYFGTK